eukprot:4175057-Prymnesium_polylepis.1
MALPLSTPASARVGCEDVLRTHGDRHACMHTRFAMPSDTNLRPAQPGVFVRFWPEQELVRRVASQLLRRHFVDVGMLMTVSVSPRGRTLLRRRRGMRRDTGA